MSLFKVRNVSFLSWWRKVSSSPGSSEASVRSRCICCMLGVALSLKVVGECFPLFCWGYSTVNAQAKLLPKGRISQEILGVVPVMAQEIFCVSVLFVLDLC